MTSADQDPFDPFGLGAVETIDEPRFGDSTSPTKQGPTNRGSGSASFDPFRTEGQKPMQRAPEPEPPLPPSVNRISRASSKGSVALPPKINVKLTIHEEATSTASQSEGSSDVIVEGKVQAQVQCSDAMKNAPFAISVESVDVQLQPNNDFVKTEENQLVVRVPKHEIGIIPIARYSASVVVRHMPLLLERKVTMSSNSCRIAVQVRSKLSNRGNMHNFVVTMAVPECIDGESISILRGDGNYNDLKRAITWRLGELKRGESFMVSAQAKLWNKSEANSMQFPVMLQCMSAADPIGDISIKLAPADGHPASVTYTTASSFRLLHRLP